MKNQSFSFSYENYYSGVKWAAGFENRIHFLIVQTKFHPISDFLAQTSDVNIFRSHSGVGRRRTTK